MKNLLLFLGLLIGASAAHAQVSPGGCGFPANPCTITGTVTTTTSATVVTPTDRGSTIAVGGTSQTLAAANASRKMLIVENPCAATEDLFVAVVGAATVGGAGNYADLAPCGSAVIAVNGTVIQTAVTVNAATGTHRFLATESQ